MLALILIIAAMIASITLGLYSGNYQNNGGDPQLKRELPYCLTEEGLDALLLNTPSFSCPFLDTPAVQEEWVLAAEDVEVARTFIHAEKQLIKRAECDGTVYYSWKCHPPDFGTLWNNTLWKLHDEDPNREIKNGDRFDVYVRKNADHEGYWMCDDSSRYPPGYFDKVGKEGPDTVAAGSSDGEIDRPDIIESSTTVNGIIVTWSRTGKAYETDVELADPNGKRKLIGEAVFQDTIYDVYENLLFAFVPDQDERYYFVPKASFESNGSLAEDYILYHVFEITSSKDVEGGLRKSLKLGSFNPLIGKAGAYPWYNVYLPESKPVVYLYPKNKRLIDVRVLPEKGRVTVSDPFYNNHSGWQNVVASPDGSLSYQGNDYSSLYYETEVAGYLIPEEGFIIPTSNTPDFLRETVRQYGLNEQELNEFMDYWTVRFEQDVTTPYLFITFISQEEMDRVVPLSINPQPDSVIRVRTYFKPESHMRSVTPQTLPHHKPTRTGFTAVEWGGILDLQ